MTPPKLEDEVIEVELIRPKPVKPKPIPPIKSKKVRKGVQTARQKKNTEAAPTIIQTKSEPAKPEPVKKPPPPVPKPKLSIRSELNKSSQWNRSNKAIIGAKEITIQSSSKDQITKPEITPLPKVDYSDQQIKSPRGNAQHSTSISDLDVREMGQDNIKTDIETGVGQLKQATDYKIMESQADQPGENSPNSGDPGQNSEFEGEIRQRKVIYKPDPPQLDINSDVTITLRFTVLPNGQVDQIFPLRKGEGTLERVAIGLLRLYKFEPLFESDSVQKGIIHFTIQRKQR